uniref:Ig-like domain-containing protein n=1 Tax=Spermophilus dauricus TaxID=99837 RepID=A0A8C9QIU0_SPEDA
SGSSGGWRSHLLCGSYCGLCQPHVCDPVSWGGASPPTLLREMYPEGSTWQVWVGLTTNITPCVSSEPKAVFAKGQLAHSEVKAQAGMSATLSCEVAQAQTEVTWYKDGKKLSQSSQVRVEASGCRRQLVVQQAGKADAGEYSCEAGGQKVSFHLDVTGGCC